MSTYRPIGCFSASEMASILGVSRRWFDKTRPTLVMDADVETSGRDIFYRAEPIARRFFRLEYRRAIAAAQTRGGGLAPRC